MRRFASILAASLAVLPAAAAAQTAPATPVAAATATVTGIPLAAAWRRTIYAFAREHFHHPAWGWQHGERDYRLATEIAAGDALTVDDDVLFAAAMLHDMAAFAPYEDKTREHGDVAAEKAAPILRDAGFPMDKYPAVAAAMSKHMYYSAPDRGITEAIALHDADSVDFLGAVGAARLLATVGGSRESMNGALRTLADFEAKIPPALITRTAQRMGARRLTELHAFLAGVKAESYGGIAL